LKIKLSDAVRRFRSGDANAADQDFLRDASDMIPERVERYRIFEDVYDQRRKAPLSGLAKQWLEAHGIPWSEGLVRKVVDTHARALTVESFEVQGNPRASEWLSTTAWPIARGPEIQSVVHTKAMMLGDGFLVADWDDRHGLPTLRWNRPHIIKPVYDDETGEMLYASKVWPTTKTSPTNPNGRLIMRMNLYYPDRVEKWFSLSTGEGSIWVRHMDVEGETWPVWWTDTQEEDGEPFGVGVIHFRRKPLGGTFGRAKAREALSFDDELAKAVLDQFEVMHEQGWQQRWATGVRSEGDKLVVRPGEIVTLGNAEARLGQFDAADPAKMAGQTKDILTRAAAMTNTPVHDLIEGDPPSGEALKTARMDFVAEAKDNQVVFGHPWAEAAGLLLRLASAHDVDLGFEVDDQAQVSPVWADPEVRNEKDEAATLLTYSELGASNHTLLRRAGFDPDEEARLRASEQPALPPPPPPPAGE
jgi:Phage portal protein, SPP1 Gp6-like